MQNITVVNEANGTVTAHKAGCADLKKAKAARLDMFTDEFASKTDVYEEYNADFLAEDPTGDSSYEIHFANCVKGLDDETKSAPTAPVVEVRGVEFKGCLCGCGTPIGSRATYRPGHDARHASLVGQAAAEAYAKGETSSVLDPEMFEDLPSTALRDKAARIALRLAEKGKNRKTTKVKAEKFEEGAPKTGTIKVGRWEYPVRVTNAGKVERNTRRDATGSWEPVAPEQSDRITWA